MVAYLKNLQGSEDFHQIVHFLNASHIRHALTENPTIYVSPINQFWHTVSTRTLDNGEIQPHATVDGQDKTITEASVGRHLKLADDDDEAISKEMHDGLGRATTIASSLEAEQGSGNIFKTQTKATPSRPSSPRTSLEGGPWCHVTMGDKVTALENELSSTKAVYNKALITLTKRVKKLEKKLKLKRRSVVVDSSEDEEASLHREAHEIAGHRIESDDTEVVDFSTAGPQSDEDEVTLAETLVNIKVSATKDKGKAIMQESEPPKKIKKKEMIQIDPAVLRYHAVQNRSFSIAEVRKNMCIYLKNQGGYKQIHFKGMRYEDIRPIFERVWDQNHAFAPKDSEIEKEVMKRSGFDLQQESSKQVEEEIVQQDDVVAEQENQDDPEKLTLMEYVEVIYDSEEVINVIPLAVKSLIMLNDFDKEDLIVLYRLFNEKYASTRPGFDDLMLWGEEKIMFEPDGEVSIHMLVEKKYPLPHDTLMRMLQWKLHVNYDVTEMAYELLRFIRQAKESIKSNTTAKLPMLKLGEYEMWVIRIKQYFQVQEYALWEVIENGNSWVSIPQTTQENGTLVTKMSVPITTKEKTNKKNDVKARSLLLMALPNEHQLTFSSRRFLPLEWNTHVVVWMNKADIETMSIDDLYNNFKIVEQDVKKSVVSNANFSDNVVYAFMVKNPNGSNLLQQDLEQIHKDDLEAIDLKWQLSLLSMRAKRASRNQEYGVGFDWSDMAEEQVQTNMALMVFSNSELNQTEFKAATYKRGLATIEEQLVTYRKNEVLFSEEVAVLKRDKFDSASKILDKLLGSQITDKRKKGLGYHVVLPPHPLIYNAPTKLDLSYSGLDEFKEPEFQSYGTRDSKQESTIDSDKKLDDYKEKSDDSFVKEQVSEVESSFVESTLNVDTKIVFPTDKKIEFVKPKKHENPVRKSVRLTVASIIFLDQPAGSGFSYARTPKAYKTNDTSAAINSYNFLRKGMSLSCISNELRELPHLNIKGYLLGNPLTDKNGDPNSRMQFAHQMALLSYAIYKSTKENCHGDYINVDPDNSLCKHDLQVVNKVIVCFLAVYSYSAFLLMSLECLSLEL
ncbi:putative ribonuclease H-like domain-containing protein [Tanacetum coccineum]